MTFVVTKGECFFSSQKLNHQWCWRILAHCKVVAVFPWILTNPIFSFSFWTTSLLPVLTLQCPWTMLRIQISTSRLHRCPPPPFQHNMDRTYGMRWRQEPPKNETQTLLTWPICWWSLSATRTSSVDELKRTPEPVLVPELEPPAWEEDFLDQLSGWVANVTMCEGHWLL